MVIPSQVRAGLCVVAGVVTSAFLPVSFGIQPMSSKARAQQAERTCVDPSPYARSVVSISRYFDQARPSAGGKEWVGERATAWFYRSPRHLVTAAHFANGLPAEGWQAVVLHQEAKDGSPDRTVEAQVRLWYLGTVNDGKGGDSGSGAPPAVDLAILELSEPFPEARILDPRSEPPAPAEPVVVLGYPDGSLRTADAVVHPGSDRLRRYAGLALLEVQGPNRLLLDHGASGAPVLDCRDGHVVAVLSGLLTSPPLPFVPPEKSIPTPWGSPTNTAVPASMLDIIKKGIL
jgi:hypothetical protein